ncbi:hypothetical protein KRR55_06095 [Paeniglutamicibacter sp. ABSL32-1]|uniref:hypothetical protein n=1 Tax=Paeniglutamicibacter quisquiliarum TaxID=2849498 RepID=UPI001C2DEFEE|nr:hypothetical protein [Paeniglutamicibacter quisquiliarum]MBV1778683.1 hypothetical protein [Paeniglutamicibacter quisquiliarum]
MTPENLTFPGVAVVAGSLMNFFADNLGGSRLWISLVIAVVFGAFVTMLAFTAKNRVSSTGKNITDIFVGLVNTLLLWITTFGVSSL